MVACRVAIGGFHQEQDLGEVVVGLRHAAIEIQSLAQRCRRFRQVSQTEIGCSGHDVCVGIAGPVDGFSSASESRACLGDDPLEDPVLLASHAVAVLFDLLFLPVPRNVPHVIVPEAGPHYTPWFPHATTRAPAGGYVPCMNEAISSAP